VERSEKLIMHHRGIPVFPTPERGVRTLAQLIPAEKKAKRAKHTFPAASGRSQLGVYESLNFIKSKGFDCIVNRLAESPGKAVHHAHLIGFPISLKIDSPDILHKSDCGGVRLNVQTPHGLRTAYDRMMDQVKAHHPNARINGVVVSAMAAPGMEIILGMNRDPQFGPLIIFGLGGIAVELFRDVSMRLLPIDRAGALEMINEIKSASLLKGFRGQQAVEENALADGLLKLAQIAEDHEDIAEIDLNPVFAYPEGTVVVDARILKV
jgi:acetyltransferase